MNHIEKKIVCGLVHAYISAHTYVVTYSVSATTLITGHERSVEEWNVWYDLQPKCQCFTLVSRERARGRGRGEKRNLDVFGNHRERMLFERVRE